MWHSSCNDIIVCKKRDAVEMAVKESVVQYYQGDVSSRCNIKPRIVWSILMSFFFVPFPGRLQNFKKKEFKLIAFNLRSAADLKTRTAYFGLKSIFTFLLNLKGETF